MPATKHAPADTFETREDRLDQLQTRVSRIYADWNDPLLVARHLVDLLQQPRAAE